MASVVVPGSQRGGSADCATSVIGEVASAPKCGAGHDGPTRAELTAQADALLARLAGSTMAEVVAGRFGAQMRELIELRAKSARAG